MRPLASGRPHPPTPPPERLRSSMLKVGFALWCFFFGYFAGIFHNGTMYALGPSSQGAAGPPLLSWPLSTTSSTAQARIVEEETAHLPADTFPLCNGQTEKDDALALYRKALRKQPPSTVVDPVVLRTCRETRKSIQQGVHPAAVAHQRLLEWCDWETQRRYFHLMPPPLVGYDTISFLSLSQLWDGASSSEFVLTRHCAGFNAHCMANGTERPEMSRETLVAQFEADFILPKFYPNISALGALVHGNSFAMELREMMVEGDWDRVLDVSRGKNVVPPEVGIIYGGYVTQYGTIFSPYLGIPTWPDEPRGELWPKFLDQYMGSNSTAQWRDVKEVLVITHHHQEMFWHWIVNEAYRLFVALPYLQANPDIFIQISGGPSYAQKYERMFHIPRWRFLSEVNVRADVVYVLQDIERSEVPSLGFAQLIRHGLLDMNDLPLDRRRSVLAKPLAPPAAGAVEQLEEAVVNILFLVRTDTFAGRIILNHKELYKAVEKLAKAFPKRFADRRKDRPAFPKRLRIELAEHVGSVSLVESRKLFGRADIVIGPHGAGFAHLYAARTGAHVLEGLTTPIQLFTGRHLNIFTCARLGLGYHAIFPNLTNDGLDEGSPSQNFIADVPLMVGIVESILTERFLT